MRRWIFLVPICIAGCYGELSLEERPCPCAVGWDCCVGENVCVRSGTECKKSDPPASQSLVVSPTKVRLRLGGTQTFTASVPVTWTVEPSGAGSIEPDGTYRAPLEPGRYQVRAATADHQTATIEVTVGPQELGLVAGRPGGAGHADGFGADVRFQFPADIAGNDTHVFIADAAGYQANVPGSIRKMSIETGEVSTLDSTIAVNRIALDGKTLYATDRDQTDEIVAVDTETGVIAKIAGNKLETAPPADGFGAEARFHKISALASDGAGTLWITEGRLLRKIVAETGEVRTVAMASTTKSWETPNPNASVAPFSHTMGPTLAVHDGFVYLTPYSGAEPASVSRYDPKTGGFEEGLYKTSPLHGGLSALCTSSDGWFWGLRNSAVMDVVNDYPLAGVVDQWGDVDGTDDGARFAVPHGLWAKSFSELYVADTGNLKLRKVYTQSLSWAVTSVAGAASHPGTENGVGSSARFDQPYRVATDPSGNLIVVDKNGFRRIDSSTGETEFLMNLGPIDGLVVEDDGTLLMTKYEDPIDSGVARVNVSKNVYEFLFTVPGSHYYGLVRKDATTLYTVEATLGAIQRIDVPSASVATVRTGLENPRELAIDDQGDRLFVSDESGLSVFHLATNELEKLPAPEAGWGTVRALAFDPAGVLFVASAEQTEIRALVVDTGKIYSMLGAAGHRGVKLGARPGGLNTPAALTLLADGSLIVVDERENVVLAVK